MVIHPGVLFYDGVVIGDGMNLSTALNKWEEITDEEVDKVKKVIGCDFIRPYFWPIQNDKLPIVWERYDKDSLLSKKLPPWPDGKRGAPSFRASIVANDRQTILGSVVWKCDENKVWTIWY